MTTAEKTTAIINAKKIIQLEKNENYGGLHRQSVIRFCEAAYAADGLHYMPSGRRTKSLRKAITAWGKEN